MVTEQTQPTIPSDSELREIRRPDTLRAVFSDALRRGPKVIDYYDQDLEPGDKRSLRFLTRVLRTCARRHQEVMQTILGEEPIED